MLTRCLSCQDWTNLPDGAGRADAPPAHCERCNAPLTTEDGPPSLALMQESFYEKYTLEAQKRRTRRGSEYYWQLYIDYKDRASAPAPQVEEPSGNGHSYPALNGYSDPEADATGHFAHEQMDDNTQGTPDLDLALSDSIPLSLFSDGQISAQSEAQSSVLTSAGTHNEVDYELIQDPSRLAAVAEMLSKETVLGLDTETTGLDPYSAELLLLQLSTPDKVYVVDCKRMPPLALKPILEDHRITKVAQNAKFEYEMLRQQAGITLAGIFDTMLAERLLTAGISREISLRAIAQKYLGAILDKTARESFYKQAGVTGAYLAAEQLHYAARDAFVMIPIWRHQLKGLQKEQLELVADIEFRCITAVGDMELAGVRIDEPRWRKIIEDVTVQRDKTAEELAELLQPATMQATMFGVPSINLNSNVQLIEVFSKLGIDLPDTMEGTLLKYDHPAVAKLLEYRGHEKTLSAFGENVLSLINPATRRIHPDFNQYGADTGRFSCTRPNVQQIPATSDFRKCFVAGEAYKLITCDYSQCELRILAELSGDEGFVSAFTSGQDLHTLTASQMFGVPVDAVQKPQRNAAKAINFGLAYGMGPGGLAPRLGVSLDEAKELIARYFKAYPGIQKWLDKAAKDAVRLGYSVTTLGRKRFYHMPDESLKQTSEDDYRKQIAAIERQGKNSPIQGCLTYYTRILVKDGGYVPIGRLAGRPVEVWDGAAFVKATVAPSGKKRLVRMTLRGGHYIECSPDHKFWVACNNGYEWVWKWKTPAEIRAQNRVALNPSAVEWSAPLDIPVSVPGTSHNASHACLTDQRDVSRLGDWLGRVASDGSLGNNTVTLVVAEHEEPILDYLRNTTEHWGHVYHDVRVTATRPRRLHRLTISAKSLHDQLLTLGIKERIPAFVWCDSSLLASYLRGLFDGDGTVHPDGALLTFGQGDRHLAWAREVQQALLLLGIRSRINLYRNEHHRINLRVLKRDMPLFCQRVGFINPIKQQKAQQIRPSNHWERVSPQYGVAMLVDSIEFTDEYVDMYDVVNSETGRFMANGMIVHNSNADMTKLALIHLRSSLKEWDARTVNTVHDEIVVEARADQAEEVKHIVEDAMVRAGQQILKVVPIVAEAAVEDYWSK